MQNHFSKYLLFFILFWACQIAQGQNVMEFAAKAGKEFSQGYTKIVADNTGGFTAIGYFDEKVIIDDGFTFDSLVSKSNSRDAFLIYFDRRTVSKDLFSIGGNGFESITDAVYNSKNELYVSGVFTDSLFPDPANKNSFINSAGSNDIYFARYKNNNELQWIKTFGSTGFEDIIGIEITPDDELYLTGFFTNTIDFNPDSLQDVKTPLFTQEVFIQKYDSSGNYLWTKTFGGRGFADIKDFHYKNGYLYLCGQLTDSVDFDPDSVGIAMEYSSNDDVFVLKLDSGANFEWVRTFGGDGLDVGNKVIADDDGNVYTAGEFRRRVDFDPGSGTQFIGSSGSEDVFVQRLDSNGNFVWVNRYIGYNNERATSLLFNSNDQSILVGGTYNGTCYFSINPILLRFSSGANDSYIHKMNKQRMLLWFEDFGKIGNQNLTDMTYDAFGNLIVVGAFRDSIEWNGRSQLVSFEADGLDGFIVKYDRQLVNTEEKVLDNSEVLFNVYPNPIKNQLNVELKVEEEVTITIKDIRGKTLDQFQNTISNFTLDFPYSNGIYIIQIQGSKGTFSKKIIKH